MNAGRKCSASGFLGKRERRVSETRRYSPQSRGNRDGRWRFLHGDRREVRQQLKPPCRGSDAAGVRLAHTPATNARFHTRCKASVPYRHRSEPPASATNACATRRRSSCQRCGPTLGVTGGKHVRTSAVGHSNSLPASCRWCRSESNRGVASQGRETRCARTQHRRLRRATHDG